MNNKIIKRNNGFTLIETMVAVIILTFSIAVFMNAISNSYFYSRYARNEITANYLLQEVVDFIKNDRDTRIVLEGGSWETFVSDYTSKCSGPLGCTMDAYTRDLNSTLASCDPDPCHFLYYHENTTTNFYNLYPENGVETSFVRKIVVTQNTNPNQLDVTVTVSWRNGNQTKSKELKTYIMNW